MLVMLMAAALAAAASAAATSESSTSAAADTPEQIIGSGAWKGSFGRREWKFEFLHQNSGWSGRYGLSDGRGWKAMTDLRVSGRSVSFGFVSRPKVRFALELDASGRNLAGTATVADLATLPFSAARVP
jgi:opacity protein-like surface antigen